MRWTIAAGLVVVASSMISPIASSQGLFQQGKTDWVSLVDSPAITVSGASPTKAEVRFRVKQDLHINSHQPHSDLLIPTTVSFDGADAAKLHLKADFPAGRDISLPFEPKEKLNVYTGEFAVTLAASAKGVKPGTYTIPATLNYQACNNASCFPPKSLKFEVDVRVP
jgi:hypothetical protein